MWKLQQHGVDKTVVSHLFQGISGIAHGFGLRGVEPSGLIQTKQVHGDRVHRLPVSQDDPIEGDAFITNHPNTVCSVRTADCVPILMVDPVRRAVAAVHAGWRGSQLNIATTTIIAMNEHFGSLPKDLVVAIGPRICLTCYDVGKDVADQFLAYAPTGVHLIGDRWHLDLGEISRQQCLAAGVASDHIDVLSLCTTCRPDLFASYRRDRGEDRQISFIALKSACQWADDV
ncbi:MAG: peptidoglycan editing factor PgeF [Deltaproteobacteria bacterium]|nr:peptidoglycan editing factor PgeF [Deltaproteobacteria bacterium]